MRRWRIGVAVVLAVWLATSVSVTRRSTIEVVDGEGRPQAAYAVYRHQGASLNPVHPLTYDATPHTVLRSTGAGQLTFPAAVHVHRPFPIQTAPSLVVEMVYAPGVHNATERLAAGGGGADGVWAFDATRGRLVMLDQSERPERWERTLATLGSALGSLVASPADEAIDAAGAAVIRELVGHLRAEVDAFLVRWGDTPRETGAADADADGRPLWGTTSRRRLARQLEWLEARAAALPR